MFIGLFNLFLFIKRKNRVIIVLSLNFQLVKNIKKHTIAHNQLYNNTLKPLLSKI